MKFRFGNSISSLFAGERKCCICKAISIKPNFNLLFHGDGKTKGLLLQGFKSLQRWVHVSSSGEDDFSELGPSITQSVSTPLKLATEKPEAFKRKDPSRKVTASRSFPAEVKPSMKSLLLNLDKASYARSKLENHNNSSRLIGTDKGDSKFEKSNCISIENVPSIINLAQLLEAVSSFGKISSVSMRNVPYGLDCCDVKFENEESSLRAVSVGEITVRSFRLPVRPFCTTKSVIVRIKDISKDTAYTVIHSVCKLIGELEGVARAREEAVDVYFSLKDDSEVRCILKKLNDTIVDDCQWSAELLSKTSTPAVMSKNENVNQELGLQICSRLGELKREFSMRKIYSEDLNYMHLAIMHLEEQPTVSNASELD